MIFASPLVDWNALGQVVLISACAGLGVAATLGVGVVSGLRAQDEQASGRSGAALALNAVLVLAVLIVIAALAVGIYFITDK